MLRFNKELRQSPVSSDAVDAYNQLGDIAMRQSRPGEAIPHFERAVRIDPADTAHK
ncbi:MAG: tetratricopeptide repeat protein [Bryobacterales bacterium]|nr:tetratricopeptide repeat protein [Bryobacterales bacterium]